MDATSTLKRAWMLLFGAVALIGNGLQHTLGTILGRTVPSVHFPRPMPGFDSSPFLIAASIWVLIQLRRTASPAATR